MPRTWDPQLVTQKIQDLNPYHAEQPLDAISLHANENPFPPPAELVAELQSQLSVLELNRYPDPSGAGLKQAIASRLQTSVSQVVLGNGSDELIQLLIQVFCDVGDGVAFPDPSFAMYSIIARGLGATPIPIDLNDAWDFEGERILDVLQQRKAKIVFFSYPNNPTGNCFSRQEIIKVLDNFKGIVVLDEAYHDFARKSFVDQLSSYPNLVVLRSLSKIGLAGLRVGYGVASPEIITQMEKIRLPYNLNSVSLFMAERLISNFEAVEKQIEIILQERERLSARLGEIENVTPFPSDSNFILFQAPGQAEAWHQSLKENGVLIRYLGAHPRLKDCLRATIGSPEQNDLFLNQLTTSASSFQ
ncbi:MAG: histidinol-phosphate transaminase [Candidatus Nitrohelix vancouverensis]|uniref:Histidinol-phosphate aminotransferase n=1 Tax=Candidatus Nitrohelix vancouverensis TaxID=2705534 RepID=A0A7T0C3C3_9BACT|nr:MAG: histidinol-phosphate transaminase [Candidatus Nitrohelix vancouverensis]